jgi:hypothetical protein
MIQKIVKIYRQSELDETTNELDFWMSRPPAERVQMVDSLRGQGHGTAERLQRVARVFRRSQDGTLNLVK